MKKARYLSWFFIIFGAFGIGTNFYKQDIYGLLVCLLVTLLWTFNDYGMYKDEYVKPDEVPVGEAGEHEE
jgi:hypothetical protein